MFAVVDEIHGYRYFLMIAVDDKFSLTLVSGVPETIRSKFHKETGHLFNEIDLLAASEGVVEQSLRNIIAKCMRGELNTGIGTGSLPGVVDTL